MFRNIRGRIRQAWGTLTGNKRTEVGGLVERGAGRVQHEVGKVERDLDYDIDRERRRS